MKQTIYNYCLKEDLFLNKQDFKKWYKIARPILNNKEFKKRRYFKHHELQTVYNHCLVTSTICYYLALKYNCDLKNCVVAGLLHDFYTEAWQYSSELESLDEKYRANFLPNKKHKSFFENHGFIHAQVAALNTETYFKKYSNEKVISAIKTHMFPLSLFTKNKFPKYKESWIVTLADKKASLKDLPSFKESFKYVGIKVPIKD